MARANARIDIMVNEMVELERKDWELIKNEATAQLKQAEIMRIVNTQVITTAIRAIEVMDEADKQAKIALDVADERNKEAMGKGRGI
jgi:transcription antitermination factor NusA-like protein